MAASTMLSGTGGILDKKVGSPLESGLHSHP